MLNFFLNVKMTIYIYNCLICKSKTFLWFGRISCLIKKKKRVATEKFCSSGGAAAFTAAHGGGAHVQEADVHSGLHLQPLQDL